ncbi:hypothetical protein [Haloferula sp.]|uniref:hypothetical protein n=1 Tax=Haloferula sp. TaxID=2497595 RepID=UPI00329CF946
MDPQDGHRHFSVDCFNQVWSLLDKSDRSAEDDRLMREMAHASLYHWLQRSDGNAENLSIGLWQISRVHAVLGEGDVARRYAEECLRISEGSELSPFYRGYALEAVARAAKLLQDEDGFAQAMRSADAEHSKVKDAESKAMLGKDLSDLGSSSSS